LPLQTLWCPWPVRWNLACFLRALRCGLSSGGCIDSTFQIPMPVPLAVQFIRL